MQNTQEELRETILRIQKKYYEFVNNSNNKAPREVRVIQKIFSALTAAPLNLLPEDQLPIIFQKIKTFEEKIKNTNIASEEAVNQFANMDILSTRVNAYSFPTHG